MRWCDTALMSGSERFLSKILGLCTSFEKGEFELALELANDGLYWRFSRRSIVVVGDPEVAR